MVAIFTRRSMQKRLNIHAAANSHVLAWRADTSREKLLRHRISHAHDRVAMVRREPLCDFVHSV